MFNFKKILELFSVQATGKVEQEYRPKLINTDFWKPINELAEFKKWDNENHVMLVRFKNNPTSAFTVQYDSEEKTIRDHYERMIDIEKIDCFAVFHKSHLQSSEEPIHNHQRQGLEENNFLVELSNGQIHHARFLMTGNRHGYSLCFANSDNRIYSYKRWCKIPEAYSY